MQNWKPRCKRSSRTLAGNASVMRQLASRKGREGKGREG